MARKDQRANGPTEAVRPPLPSGAQKGYPTGRGTVPHAAAVGNKQPGVVGLGDPVATEAALTGAKAAALAKATVAGLPVLPGMVLTTAATGSRSLPMDDLRHAWAHISREGARSLVVRSSSTAEDGSTSSMAGQFTSV